MVMDRPAIAKDNAENKRGIANNAMHPRARKGGSVVPVRVLAVLVPADRLEVSKVGARAGLRRRS